MSNLSNLKSKLLKTKFVSELKKPAFRSYFISSIASGIALIAIFVVGFVYFIDNNSDKKVQEKPLAQIQRGDDSVKELTVDVIKESEGQAIKEGDVVQVLYKGTLVDGTVFDSSKPLENPEPIPVTVGAGSVIPGWDQGLIGMKQGGKYKLSIPSALAYGESGSGKILPGSSLIFEMEIVKVDSPK